MKYCVWGMGLVLAGSVAYGQDSTTNCYSAGYSVQCRTRSNPSEQQQQIQQNLDQAFSNLGTAIAERRERKQRERAAEQAAIAEADNIAAIKAALNADTAAQLPSPTDERPVILACTMNGGPSSSLALYEKHGRVDTTFAGTTRTRQAIYSVEAITWTTPLIQYRLNRLDGSYVGYGNIREISGQSITGTCAVASERKF